MSPETIVITGASRGIGAATARRLGRPGRHLVLLARTGTDLARVCHSVRSHGARADYLPVDLSSRRQVNEAIADIEDAYAPVDGLVLNAGMSLDERFVDGDSAEVDREFQVNFFAPAAFLRRFLGAMLERDAGRVAVVGSLTSDVPFPGNATYAASKAALRALVRSLRLELVDANVHLGLVLPGMTRTAMTSELASFLPSMPPEAVARGVERSLEQQRPLVVPGLLNNLAFRLFAAAPELADAVLSWLPKLVPAPDHAGPPSKTPTRATQEATPWPSHS